jgi:hypothetical protein
MGVLAHPPTPADRVTVIAGLASFGDPTILRRALDATLTDAVRMQDALRMIYSAWGNPLRRPTVYAWVHEHYDGLRARLPEETMGYLGGMVGGTCTVEALASERAFFEPRLAQIEGAERGLREAVDRAEQCIAFRAHEHDRSVAILHDADDAVTFLLRILVFADVIGHVAAGCFQLRSDEHRGAFLVRGELGMSMDVLVNVEQGRQLVGGDALGG